MSNIESRTEPETHDRFKMRPLLIRLLLKITSVPSFSADCYRFFHPPRCPGAPPLERGAGPNSGPDWRESVGWKILLAGPAPVSSGEGLR